MSPHIVVLGSSGSRGVRAVRDALQDWCAAGLVSSFIWVDDVDCRAETATALTPATVVRLGGRVRVRLHDHLANQPGNLGIRLVCLGFAGVTGGSVPAGAAARFLEGLHAPAGGVTSINLLLARRGMEPANPDTVRSGWHNVVISPEDAWHPGSWPEELVEGDSDDEFDGHAAAAVAGVAGLWVGIDQDVFDRRATPSAGQIVLARSFFRRLDGSRAAADLRSRLLHGTVQDGFPAPRVGVETMMHFSAPSNATQAMAEALVGKHAELFQHYRQTRTAVIKKSIGFLALLRHYFSFVFQLLRGAPAEWWRATFDRAATSAARRVSAAVFGGAKTDFDVIVAGRSSSGGVPSVIELASEADELSHKLSRLGTWQEDPPPTFSRLWGDFAAGAMTLADGAEHSAGMSPVLVGARAGIVREPGAIVSPPAGIFELTPHVAAELGQAALSPYDSLTIAATTRRLESVAKSTEAWAVEAGRESDRLRLWNSARAASYTGRVGDAIATFLAQSKSDVRSLLLLLAEVGGRETVPADVEAQRTLTKRIRRWTYALAAVLVLIVGVATFSLLPLAVCISLALLGLGGWLGGTFAAFRRHTQAMFARLYSARQSEEQTARIEADLRAAASELKNAIRMYDQWLLWGPVVGLFLHEPFGRAVDDVEVQPRLSGTLPRSMGIGVATPTDDVLAAAAAVLAPRLFTPGWLAECWTAFLADGRTRLGVRGLRLPVGGGALLQEQETGEDSLLRQWSRLVAADGVGDAAADAIWHRAAQVVSQDQGVVSELVARVECEGQIAHGIPGAMSGAEFIATLKQDFDQQGMFLKTVLKEHARTRGGLQIAETVVDESAYDGVRQTSPLDRMVSVLQLSHPIPMPDLDLNGVSVHPPGAGPPPPDEVINPDWIE